MTTIFISGSREIPYIPESVTARVDKIIDSGFGIVIGDSEKGVDAAIIRYLASCNYPNVSVYTIHGKPRARDILDCWNVCRIEPDIEEKSDASGNIRNRRELETEKDRAMGNAADFGLVIWKSSYKNRFGRESASKGSLRNMHQLLSENKPVVLYKASSDAEEDNEIGFYCYELRSIEDLGKVLDGDPEVVVKAYNEIEKSSKRRREASLFD